jgi:hypothetical protein
MQTQFEQGVRRQLDRAWKAHNYELTRYYGKVLAVCVYRMSAKLFPLWGKLWSDK